MGRTAARIKDLTGTLFSRGSSTPTEAQVLMALLVEGPGPPSPVSIQTALAGNDLQCVGKGSPIPGLPDRRTQSVEGDLGRQEGGWESRWSRTELGEHQCLSYQKRKEPAKEMEESTKRVEIPMSKVSQQNPSRKWPTHSNVTEKSWKLEAEK